MKIRRGFVSNSSSSSFFYIVSKSHFDEVCKKLSRYVVAVANSIADEKKLFGRDVVILKGFTDQGGDDQFTYAEINEEDTDDIGPYEAFKLFKEELNKNTDEVCYVSVDH